MFEDWLKDLPEKFITLDVEMNKMKAFELVQLDEVALQYRASES